MTARNPSKVQQEAQRLREVASNIGDSTDRLNGHIRPLFTLLAYAINASHVLQTIEGEADLRPELSRSLSECCPTWRSPDAHRTLGASLRDVASLIDLELFNLNEELEHTRARALKGSAE